MDQELKDLVDDLASFDPDDAAHSPSDLQDMAGACSEAIKAITDPVKGDINKLDGESLDAADTLSTKLESVNAAIKARADKAKAIKARVSESKAFNERPVNRPSYGGSGTVAGTGVAVKTETLEATESEDEKYVARGPFKGAAHFCYEVRRAGKQPGHCDRGLLGEWNGRVDKIDTAVKAMGPDQKALSGLGELADDEGAAFVPLQIAANFWERSKEQTNLLSLVQNTSVNGNNLTIKAAQDKTASATAGYFGGALAYWKAEADQLTSSKPKTRDINFKLNKLTAMVYASDELLEDSTAMESYMGKTVGYALTRKINEAIIRGTGVGMPLGILSSPALLTIAAVSGQGANTVIGQNIDEMWVRRPDDAESSIVWLYIMDAEAQFSRFNYNVANTGATFIYLPAGGLAGTNVATLKGCRTIATAHCNALGTAGDVIMWETRSYMAITKSSGINQATSIHLRFDYDETCFRWTFRMDGKPLWAEAFTPERGSTRSPMVVLNSTRT